MLFRFFYLLLFIGLFFACRKVSTTTQKTTLNSAYDKAFDFREAGRTDSAYYYFNIAKDEFLKNGDSLGVAKCLVNLAIANTNKGDYYGGIETGIDALDYFDQENPSHATYLNSNYINLGLAHYFIKDWDKSLTFYQEALKYAVDLDDSLVALNNAGKMFEEQRDFQSSIDYYNQVIKLSKEQPLHYARALANVAVSKWKFNSNYDPVPELLASVRIRDSIGDVGLIYSYIALSDVYLEKNRATAKAYAFKALDLANKYRMDNDRMEALKRLVILSPEFEASVFFKQYTQISDSVQRSWGMARNKYAMIRYETELYKSQKTILEKDNQIKSIQIVFLGLGLILIVGVGFYYIKRTKYIANLKAQRSIQENRLKTSKQVHDVVANGLYRVMNEIENTAFDKEEILDKLEVMYEKSRDISYQDESPAMLKFKNKIEQLVSSFQSAKQQLFVDHINVLDEIILSSSQEQNLYLILQELFVNAAKHSMASVVRIKFKVYRNKLLLNYVDNGVGFKADYSFNNGLTSTVTRINVLSGSVNFVNPKEGGLEINMEIPL